uniref:YadA-like family protein n=1 Tax=uncultured Dialister sp. TaxID=278064 RepID=UPI0026DCD245
NKDAINKEVQDRTKAVADEAKARADKDTEHDTAIAANKKAIGDEAAARKSGDNALQNQIKKESAARQADISRLDNKIHDVSKEVDTVGALSMAMSGLHPLSYDEGDARFQLSAAVGTYDGTEALALGGFYHFNRDSMLSVGVATDLGADEHRMGANVGYTRRIGQGGHVSRPSEGTVSDIMKDIKNLEQKQAKLEQENEQLKKQLASLKK